MEVKKGSDEALKMVLAEETISGKLPINTTSGKLLLEVRDKRNGEPTSEKRKSASVSTRLAYLNLSGVADFKSPFSKKQIQSPQEVDTISRDSKHYACVDESSLWTVHQDSKQQLYCDRCLNSFTNPLHHKPIAISMCFDCCQYLCVNCLTTHSKHLSYRIDSGNNQTDKKTFFRKTLEKTRTDSLKSANKFDEEKLVVCDRVTTKFSEDTVAGEVEDICLLDGGKMWAITEFNNRCIKLFDACNNKFVRYIKLSSGPVGVTEIPVVGSPSSLNIAVACPSEHEIIVIDLLRIPSRIIQSISVEGVCRYLFSCEETMVVYCEESHTEKSVHVISKEGNTLNIINLSQLFKLSGKSLSTCSVIRVCVHRSSNTIYISSLFDRILISCDIHGQFLNYFKFEKMYPSAICVDADSHVYVLTQDQSSCLYKFSKDLNWSEQMLDDTVGHIERVKTMTVCRDKFYFVNGWDMHQQNIITVMRNE